MDRRSFFKLAAKAGVLSTGLPAALASTEPGIAAPAAAYTVPPGPILTAVRTLQSEGWRIKVVLGAEGKLEGIAARGPAGMTPRDRHVRYFEVMQGICPMQMAELLHSAGWAANDSTAG